jgi:hypothetical protein
VTQGDTDRETTPHRLSDLNESERDRRFAALIPSQQRCHLIPYNATVLERDIALTLGIPMYGTDSRLADLGSKDGRPPIVRGGSGCLIRSVWGPAQLRGGRKVSSSTSGSRLPLSPDDGSDFVTAPSSGPATIRVKCRRSVSTRL